MNWIGFIFWGRSIFKRWHCGHWPGLPLLYLLISTSSFAQTTVQVITKIVDKELPYTIGKPIFVNAQKADITIKGWDRAVVGVRLRLIAKHPDRSVAERELTYHQYSLQAQDDQIVLANHFVIAQQAHKLQSQLKAIYEVNVPIQALATIRNTFGNISLNNLSGTLSVTFEFGKLTLQNIGGALTITSDYGDIEGQTLAANLNLKAEKADISLRDLAGTATLKTNYGKLSIEPSPTLNSLKVDATFGNIKINSRRIADFQYDLTTWSDNLTIPEAFSSFLTKHNSKQLFSYQPPGRKPQITILNRYGPISLQSDKSTPVVDR